MTNSSDASVATQLAQARSALSFERTRMSIDRTMMSVLRTSFSMISFGFTLFTIFTTLKAQDILGDAVPVRAPAWFGLTLVLLGILVLAHGIWSEHSFRKRLTKKRDLMMAAGLLEPDVAMPQSAIHLAALLLLLIGVLAVLGIAARVGPFS